MPSMKKLIAITIVATVALAGCKKKSEDAPGGAASGGGGGGDPAACAAAISKGIAGLGAGPEASVVKDKLQSIYVKHCTENKWSAEVLQCFETASGMGSMKACRAKLPPEQSAKLQAEIVSTMASAGAAMGGAMGSAMGGAMGHAAGVVPGGSGAPAGGDPAGSAAAPAK
jgi:hypothetical protein